MLSESAKCLGTVVSDKLALNCSSAAFRITRRRTVTVSMLQDRGVPLKTSCRVNSMHLQVFVKKIWEDRGPEFQKVMTRSSCMRRQ
jgi:hypothetical protein